jgi:hypothetical protein
LPRRKPEEAAGRRVFESLRLHQDWLGVTALSGLRPSPCLRSVNGKHAPFVRPRCGFDSCRRLMCACSSEEEERCPAKAEVAGSIPVGRMRDRLGVTALGASVRALCGCSSDGKSAGSPARRRPFEAGRPRLQAHGVTASTASSNLAGPGSNPGGPAVSPSSRAGAARLSLGQRAFGPAVRPRKPDRTPRPRRLILLRAGAVPVIAS